MVPPLLFDISQINLDHVQFGVDEIEKTNPHRGHMRMIDGINYMSDDLERIVAFKDVRADEFWVPGHIPGRPLFPGVLMIEAAAQVASFVAIKRLPGTAFVGFAGVEEVKFRGQVVPGDRLVLLGVGIDLRPRRIICQAQGLLRGTIVFEAKIIGMPF
ncbi:MAG: beta-hydroxyacyl-ACP dehydratase [Phycisphaeraceae bacterium]|nr:beta-hydroxyacyl-ACP dehydratase [Phycisphaeraceae bacterium]